MYYIIILGSFKRVSGFQLYFYQYIALLIKRWHYSRRKPLAFSVQNVLPLVVIAFCLVIAHFLLTVGNPPALLLHPSMFFRVSPYNYAIVGNNASGTSKDFIDTVFQQCGLGAKLLANPLDPNSPCYHDKPVPHCDNYDELNINYNTTVRQSDCVDRVHVPLHENPPLCYNGTIVCY